MKFRSFLFVISILHSIYSFAQAQIEETTVLPAVTVEATEEASSSLLGFEGFLLQNIPVSAKSYSDQSLHENRILRLADLTSLDGSLTDSYNATGYWDMVSVRGYTLDNRSNYRREGLPINAETSIPLENKASIQVLKGLAGIQSGVSTPGGVINYQVKRPKPQLFLDMHFDVSDSGNFLVALDSGGPHPKFENLDFRINMAYENLSPHLKDAHGSRSVIGMAGSYRLPNQALLEAEFEISARSQPSQPGMSLLGANLPQVQDASINLNNQSWSEPVQFLATTGTLKYSQNLKDNLTGSVVLGIQNLVNDDHLAYPFGCTKEGNFDRYCSDGTFDFYDFRSDNEQRNTSALRLALDGVVPGMITHTWSVGLMGWQTRERYQRQAYNYVGEGNIEGTVQVPANAALNDESTNRDADNLQLFAADSIKWNAWTGWLGASWNGIQRSSIRTDGSRPTEYYQSFVLPWTALSYQFSEAMLYISYAQGMESFVTPNRNAYSHPGEFLPDVRSHQYELGARGVQWSANIFQISRPVVTDLAPAYQVDGEDLHQGLEAEFHGLVGRWQWDAAGMLLQAKRQNSDLIAGVNGNKPVNVPEATLRLGGGYQTPWIKGLTLKGRLIYEAERAVLADNSLLIPGWVRWDLGVEYADKAVLGKYQIAVIVTNLLDKKYWREAPTQYGHVYLYPGAERSVLFNLTGRFY